MKVKNLVLSQAIPTLSEVQDYTKPEEVELSPEDAPKANRFCITRL